MTDLEISKALALAIGHEEQYTSLGWWPRHFVVFDRGQGAWREFDYRDWAIIGPIAERYNCFWWVYEMPTNRFVEVEADTPRKALALAVIQGADT